MLRGSGHDHVPLHDGAGGKKMVGTARIKPDPSPFAVADPRDEDNAARARARGSMPPTARPWGREEDMLNNVPVETSPGGKAMGAYAEKYRGKLDAPFALDPRKGPAPPPGDVFGDAWQSPTTSAPLPSVNSSAPFGTDYTAPVMPEESHKPWNQQKPAPWDNPHNKFDDFKFGRRMLEEKPGEAGPMTKDAKAVMRDELRGQMEAQLHHKKVAREEYANGGVGAPPVGQLRPSRTRPW